MAVEGPSTQLMVWAGVAGIAVALALGVISWSLVQLFISMGPGSDAPEYETRGVVRNVFKGVILGTMVLALGLRLWAGEKRFALTTLTVFAMAASVSGVLGYFWALSEKGHASELLVPNWGHTLSQWYGLAYVFALLIGTSFVAALFVPRFRRLNRFLEVSTWAPIFVGAYYVGTGLYHGAIYAEALRPAYATGVVFSLVVGAVVTLIFAITRNQSWRRARLFLA